MLLKIELLISILGICIFPYLALEVASNNYAFKDFSYRDKTILILLSVLGMWVSIAMLLSFIITYLE